jgi:hypothetical protein
MSVYITNAGNRRPRLQAHLDRAAAVYERRGWPRIVAFAQAHYDFIRRCYELGQGPAINKSGQPSRQGWHDIAAWGGITSAMVAVYARRYESKYVNRGHPPPIEEWQSRAISDVAMHLKLERRRWSHPRAR